MDVFSLPLKKYAYPLLKQVMTEEKIPQSLIMISLDWRKPWNFLSTLKEALTVIESHFESVSPALLSERKSFLEHLYQLQYMGQLSESDAHLLPLDTGVLSKSIGIPIVIACEYAEYIDNYRKEGTYTNDTLDKIQQVLRTIGLCCKYRNTHWCRWSCYFLCPF
jgi:dynein light intermediate chain 1